MKQSLFRYQSFIKYLICGGISTGIDFLGYMILSNHINISIAKLISMCIASIISFILNKYWTFQDTQKVTRLQMLQYILTQLANVTVNVAANKIIYTLSDLKVLAFIIATGIAMIANYFMQKVIVFKRGM